MKRLSLRTAMLLVSLTFGQSVGVNSDGAAPDASDMPGVKSTSKGFLALKMTNEQQDGVVTPVTGPLIGQTDGKADYDHCNGTNWENASDACQKGDLQPLTNCGLAQDVKKINSKELSGSDVDWEKVETMDLSYGNIVSVLAKAIQEQQATIEAPQKQIDELTKLENQMI